MFHQVTGNIKEIIKNKNDVTYQHSLTFDTETASSAKLKFIQFFENKSDPFGVKYHTWNVKALPLKT